MTTLKISEADTVQLDTSGNWRRAAIRDSLFCGDVLGGWA
ncbi:MAG: hypothetical protein FD149_2783 [Rhodospirillaceae bacterium]|nr:MAG: hypothetical protein FD149_2783 [Rhodospirillaceae bacterium]